MRKRLQKSRSESIFDFLEIENLRFPNKITCDVPFCNNIVYSSMFHTCIDCNIKYENMIIKNEQDLIFRLIEERYNKAHAITNHSKFITKRQIEEVKKIIYNRCCK